jgi:Cytochrome P450
MVQGKVIQGIFNSQDEALHRAMRRPIAGIYSMTNLVEFEPYVDTTIRFFLSRLEDLHVRAGAACDLGTWLQWFAFDVMGEITFSKRLGFLDEAREVEGIIGSIWKMSQYSSWVRTIPPLETARAPPSATPCRHPLTFQIRPARCLGWTDSG